MARSRLEAARSSGAAAMPGPERVAAAMWATERVTKRKAAGESQAKGICEQEGKGLWMVATYSIQIIPSGFMFTVRV